MRSSAGRGDVLCTEASMQFWRWHVTTCHVADSNLYLQIHNMTTCKCRANKACTQSDEQQPQQTLEHAPGQACLCTPSLAPDVSPSSSMMSN